jgi:hypothetical protein
MQYERPNVLRGVHFGPNTSCGFDVGWWVQFLKDMHMGWVKIVDDAGSMMNFAKACRAAGIMPIIRFYRQYPYPGTLREKDIPALRAYIDQGITRWIESGNEPNLYDPEWHPDHRPTQEPVIGSAWFTDKAIPTVAANYVADAETIISYGGYPAFPAMAQCGFHGNCSSITWYRSLFNYLRDHYFDRTKYIFEHGGWLAVHDATLNHFYQDSDGKWHFEYPYDPVCQANHPGRTILDDDNSALGHEAPRTMIRNRWGLDIPIISTEGGVFLWIGYQQDANYPVIRDAQYHGEATRWMFNFFDEYQKSNPEWYGMCPWLVGEQVLGHQGYWEAETWKKVDHEEPVVNILKASWPRQIDVPDPDPLPDPLPPPSGSFPRPPKDNGLGIHMGQGLTDWDVAREVPWMIDMKLKWSTVAYTNEEALLRAAKALWAAGIMPISRWVGCISKAHDFARDAKLLIDAGIPAYIQIFNEPSDDREWENGRPADYVTKWADFWVLKASEVVNVGGYAGLQCLHPGELLVVFNKLPKDSAVWKKVWFCSHNYGLNHPPAWKDNEWCVLGFEFFADLFKTFLGYVPPIICGEGGWLYNAYDDHNFSRVDGVLHANYHKEMFEQFRLGKLSDGKELPDYLYAVCPWILAGSGDEPWYGWSIKQQTIDAIRSIPSFIRGEKMLQFRVFDEAGNEQLYDWAVQKYGVAVDVLDGEGWHCTELRERCGPSGVELYVYKEDGSPAAGVRVWFYWPDGSDYRDTESTGKAGFGYGPGSYIKDVSVGGPHSIIVEDKSKCDHVTRLGMLAGTEHCHLDLIYQYGAMGEELPIDPSSIIMPLAEDLLEAIPVPETWALPAAAKKAGYSIQVGGYGRIAIDGVTWLYQTFTRAKQDKYVVAFCKEGDWSDIKVVEVVRN